MLHPVLKIQVFQGTDKVHEIENAQPTNIQSCIDLWHAPSTQIILSFDEVDVPLQGGNLS